MDAPKGFCGLCGRPSKERHHLTGRDTNGVYVHPGLLADLCHQHHVFIHNVLRSQHIDTPPVTPDHPFALVGYVLRRLAVFIGLFAARADNPVWVEVAQVLEDCAAQLDTPRINGVTLAAGAES